jgi:hypothetical protein
MKPKPFSVLKNFTLPLAIVLTVLLGRKSTLLQLSFLKNRSAPFFDLPQTAAGSRIRDPAHGN